MADSREKRAAEIQNSIRQILHNDWSPIPGDLPLDEYDSYIILVGSRSELDLIDFLYRTVRDTIGMACASPDQLQPVARKLLVLDVRLRR